LHFFIDTMSAFERPPVDLPAGDPSERQEDAPNDTLNDTPNNGLKIPPPETGELDEHTHFDGEPGHVEFQFSGPVGNDNVAERWMLAEGWKVDTFKRLAARSSGKVVVTVKVRSQPELVVRRRQKLKLKQNPLYVMMVDPPHGGTCDWGPDDVEIFFSDGVLDFLRSKVDNTTTRDQAYWIGEGSLLYEDADCLTEEDLRKMRDERRGEFDWWRNTVEEEMVGGKCCDERIRRLSVLLERVRSAKTSEEAMEGQKPSTLTRLRNADPAVVLDAVDRLGL
jgi:hypothetical protein